MAIPRKDRGMSASLPTWAPRACACPAVILLICLLACMAPVGNARAASLDVEPFSSFGFEAVFSRIEGRMGFEQEGAAPVPGTLNDFNSDIGLPANTSTYRFLLSVRPLEHHVARVYGSIPERYKGGQTLTRTLVTRARTYAEGTLIASELRTGMFGFGYDCDLLVRPMWYGGLTADLRYLDLKVKMGLSENDWEDTMTLDELVPCLGAHFDSGFATFRGITAGVFARLTYSVSPNYLNYFDGQAGLRLAMQPTAWFGFNGKVGYEHESFLYEQERTSARHMEFKRDGIMFSVEIAF